MAVTETRSADPPLNRRRVQFDSNDHVGNSPKRPRNHAHDNTLTNDVTRRVQHLNIKPSGNLLLNSGVSIRELGLGTLRVFSDPLLLAIISILAAREVLCLGSCSKALFAYCSYQPIWKDLFVRSSNGVLGGWAGTWRKTYLQLFAPTELPQSQKDRCMRQDFETPVIDCTGLYSDELYQPYLCANTDIVRYFYPRNSRDGSTNAPRSTITRVEASAIAAETFERDFGSKSEPVIVSNASKHLSWPAYSTQIDENEASAPRWALENLLPRFSHTSFRAEAFDCSLQTYSDYAANCSQDDSPVYLFDSRFVEKTVGNGDLGMGADYDPPALFGEDLFKLMEDKRPDYRWLIIGPERSGSTFHKDPNATSAWNAVITGRKGWVMFPPDVCPPGVYVSEDEAEVTSPLSLAEWFMSYFDAAWAEYGPNSSSPNRGKMRVGVCHAGEIVYVPSGWWHLVVNLEASVAVTQNFASEHELVNVLRFMRDKSDQISGWSDDIQCAQLYDTFCEVLRRERPNILQKALEVLDRVPKRGGGEQRSVWDQVTKSQAEKVDQGFSFGFEFDDDGDLEGDKA